MKMMGKLSRAKMALKRKAAKMQKRGYSGKRMNPMGMMKDKKKS